MPEHAQQVLTEEVPAPAEQVRAFYADLDNIKTVHPLVVAVRTISRRDHTRTYRVTDRIRLGPVTLRTTYWAQLTVTDSGDITSEARQFPGVRLCTVVTFEPVRAGTRVTERITIQAPRPLFAFTARQAITAHRAMLAGIRRHFAG
ncbi:SRPBCC family protein [Mycolicibacterium holsaticum]|uniref:Polyketide cyclase / dehydrase and lipid transport n=1 Tax=Mycolicibacterium holsaticum TaxID=152142 RepID=A0A1E3RW77_9MYCO|nr:SRPBCC family protein [Mycolicibacterium holsaticum]ODQ93627.1 polyketide cyclase / dehydrase and lipid transport [Mycolicibacterium holsaticum]